MIRIADRLACSEYYVKIHTTVILISAFRVHEYDQGLCDQIARMNIPFPYIGEDRSLAWIAKLNLSYDTT